MGLGPETEPLSVPRMALCCHCPLVLAPAPPTYLAPHLPKHALPAGSQACLHGDPACPPALSGAPSDGCRVDRPEASG